METPITKSEQSKSFASNKDTPIALADLTKLDDEEREILLLGIRERRLYAAKIFDESNRLKQASKAIKLEEDLDNQLRMFAKEALRADKAIEKLEVRINRLRMLEMEING